MRSESEVALGQPKDTKPTRGTKFVLDTLLTMYIVLIALVYIWLMLIVASPSLADAFIAFFLGGLVISLVYYLLNTPTRRRLRRHQDED
jgi:hypothetical protein